MEDLQDIMDTLFGYPAYSSAWEEVIFTARLKTYQQIWLESLFQNNELFWFGAGKNRAAFSFSEDLELFLENAEEEDSQILADFFPSDRGKYSFLDLKDNIVRNHPDFEAGSADLTGVLWDNVWEGRISNDNINTLRNGILNKFKTEKTKEKDGKPRGGFSRWQSARPLQGGWFILPRNFSPDPVEELELQKYRIRQLFSRYGVLFREILANEMPLLQWKNIFRTLRLMELSGEIMSGHFFSGIPGIQFISHDALKIISEGLPEDKIFWLNAVDPASVCGIKTDEFRNRFPQRIPANYYVMHGTKLAVTAKRQCRELDINADPDDENIPEYLSFFRILLDRQFNPLRKIVVETVNGTDAGESEFFPVLAGMGFKKAYKNIELWKM